MSNDSFEILQQLPGRDGFQLRYAVRVDSQWHPLPPALAAAGRQSFAANRQQEWLHAWTEKGLLTEQNIVSPQGESGFKIRTWRWLTTSHRIESRTEILNAEGEVATWLGGTWKKRPENLEYALAVLDEVADMSELQCWPVTSPEVKLVVVQVSGQVSANSAFTDLATELAKERDICVLVLGTASGGVMVDGGDLLGVIELEPVVFDSSCGRIGCGLTHQQAILHEWAADLVIELGPFVRQIRCPKLTWERDLNIPCSEPMTVALVRQV